MGTTNTSETGTPRRRSRQRDAILAFLSTTQRHPSAEEILHAVRKREPKIGLATVYRNLESLLRDGLVSRTFHENIARYDARVDAHHHFICRACGEIMNVEPVPGERSWIASFQRRSGAKVETLASEIHGQCRDCRRKS